MILPVVLVAPLLCGIVAWFVAKASPKGAQGLCVAELLATTALLATQAGGISAAPTQFGVVYDAPWISSLDIHFSLGLDGLALLMTALTLLLGVVAVAAAPRDASANPGAFLFHIMASLTGLIGVFLARDLFLFFVCYEVMLIPMYFLMTLWGQGERVAAAVKFFIFTQAGGLLMLIAIIAVATLSKGQYTFAGPLHSDASPLLAFLLLGFTLAFAVKLPVVPFHAWQPDAYSAAPTSAAIVLAGLMSKAGAYGLLRFAIPLFPEAAHKYAPLALGVGAITVLYGAALAFAQTDFRRLIAYSSMSHLGFVLMAAFAMNPLAYKGAVMTMICHALSVAGLFLLEQAVRARVQGSDLERMGGLWRVAPRLGATGLVFTMATLGIPGLGNFIGEFLVLLGVYQASPLMAALAALGMVLSAVYALWMMQRVFFGPRDAAATPTSDASLGYLLLCAPLIIALLWLGFFPQTALRWVESSGYDIAMTSTPADNVDRR